MEQAGIFDEIERLERLSELGDPLNKLNEIDWDMFVPMIRKALAKTPKGPGGRPRYDIKLMLKVLMLKRMYNLSFEQTEYQINDRLSFMRFLDLGLYSTVPDAKTIWLFRETLKNAGKASFLEVRIHKGLKGKLPPLDFDHREAIDALIEELNK